MSWWKKQPVPYLVEHINDRPYFDHQDWTFAVDALIEVGRPALSGGALELLLNEDGLTREHAENVLYNVVRCEAGWRLGKGWPPEVDSHEMDREFKELWVKNGDYKWDAPFDTRKASYLKWRQWLDENPY